MGILDGKVAIVTGGARGIGRAAVEAMVAEGCRVLVNDLGVTRDGRDPDPGAAAAFAADLQSRGFAVAANHDDCATAEGARRIVADCLASFGRVDILYNNAGFMAPSPVVSMSHGLWHAVVNVHVMGTVHCIRAALPYLVAQGSGVVLNTSSPGALWGSPNLAHYGAAKGAVWALTNALSREVYEAGVRVNTLVPGADTGRHVPEHRAMLDAAARAWAMPGIVRAGTPDPGKLGPLVAYLVSDECADITGRTIFAGGDRIAWYREIDQPQRAIVARGDGWSIAGLQKQFHHSIPPGPPQPYVGEHPPFPLHRPRTGEVTKGQFAGTLDPEGLLEGKVIAITGGGRGIGRAAALKFASLGARVVVNDFGIGYDSLEPEPSYAHEVVRLIEANGGQAVASVADVTDPAGAASIVEDALRAFGQLDVLYNNAGFSIFAPLLAMDAGTWDLVFAVNLHGTFNCTKAALPPMLERGRGAIVNTSSPGALWGSPLGTPYAAGKGGVWAFTRCLYKEVYEAGITVNTLVPGADTNRQPELRALIEAEARKWVRLGSVRSGTPTPERVAPITAYLMSDECRDVTGRTIYAAGNTLALYEEPRLVNTLIMEGGWTVPGLRRALHAVVPAGPPSPYIGAGEPAAVRRRGATPAN